jgi:hypothetical protein
MLKKGLPCSSVGHMRLKWRELTRDVARCGIAVVVVEGGGPKK